MTDVRTSVPDGFVEVRGADVVAVVEVADRHREALENAASEGMLQLLDLLCSRGLLVMPAFALATAHGDGVRVLLRGAATAALPDGSVVGAEDRLPWREVVLEAPASDVVLSAVLPEPEVARGWRRPARLRAGAGAAAAVPVPEPEPEVGPEVEACRIVECVDSGPARAGAEVGHEVEDVQESSNVSIDAQAASSPSPSRARARAGPSPESEPEPEPDPSRAGRAAGGPDAPPPEDSIGQTPAERVPASPPPDGRSSTPCRGAAPVGASPGPPRPSPRRLSSDRHPRRSSARSSPSRAEHHAEPEPTPRPRAGPGAGAAPVPDAAPEVTTARAALPRHDEDLDRPVVLAVSARPVTTRRRTPAGAAPASARSRRSSRPPSRARRSASCASRPAGRCRWTAASSSGAHRGSTRSSRRPSVPTSCASAPTATSAATTPRSSSRLARPRPRPRVHQRHHGRPARRGAGAPAADRGPGHRTRSRHHPRRRGLADLRGRGMTPADAPVIPGLTFVRPLGSGGYADVYLYEQQSPRMNVAVKVLKRQGLTASIRRQFVDEANTMAQLADHPYIVQVFRSEQTADGGAYLVMKYYPPPNLAQRAKAERLTVEEVLRTGIQLASAVETAHRAGIVHRDIKRPTCSSQPVRAAGAHRLRHRGARWPRRGRRRGRGRLRPVVRARGALRDVERRRPQRRLLAGRDPVACSWGARRSSSRAATTPPTR